jgi:hypothetical protein
VSYPGTVVVSADGRLALRILDWDGTYAIPNRDAIGVYLAVQPKPSAERSRVAVLFSGLSQSASWSAYGLPDVHDSDARLLYFSEAAIGEFLDTRGMPKETPSGTDAFKIECFSYTFQAWAQRPQALDDDILRYMEAKLYWSWSFGLSRATFGRSDFLRLRSALDGFRRVAALGEGMDWVMNVGTDYTLEFEPTPTFLRRYRDQSRRKTPTSAETILLALAAPRYDGPREHWGKALRYRGAEHQDLPNCAKEAVSAVEGMARVLTGRHSDTLGDLIKRMREEAIIDGPMAKTLEGLWAMTNSAPGVRHGATVVPPIDENQVDFILSTAEGSLRFLLNRDR